MTNLVRVAFSLSLAQITIYDEFGHSFVSVCMWYALLQMTHSDGYKSHNQT